MLELSLDLLLILTLIAIAAGVLFSRDLFRAVVLFIAFGMLLSLAWMRLQAPDLALAEAAVGAGLAGALLLDAVSQLRQPAREKERMQPMVTAALCIGLSGILIWTLVDSPRPSPALAQALAGAMPDSGVSHEVTAVLLNFRGYDTFVEIAVLAVAVFIGLALRSSPQTPPARQQISDPILDALVIWLAPLMLMVAGYLFWAGSKQPGGAFQAGAVLAASGVLLRLAAVQLPFLAPGLGLRLGLMVGFLGFLLAGVSGPLLGLPLFSYSPDQAHAIILAVEALLTLSIGLTLLGLFTTAPPDPEGPRG